MPKMQAITDEMKATASRIGDHLSLMTDSQGKVRDALQTILVNFDSTPKVMTALHLASVSLGYQNTSENLKGYQTFLVEAADTYEWNDAEIAKWADQMNEQRGVDIYNYTSPNAASGGPVATQADNDKWGWNTENLPFSNSAPDLNSVYYSNTGDSNAPYYAKANKYIGANPYDGKEHDNCVHYARARYMEVNGTDSYPYAINECIYDPEYIKNGNCVVRCSGHSVYVEYYDAENDVVWFSDSNMASHQDGALQSMSFEEFKNFHGGVSYVEGRR